MNPNNSVQSYAFQPGQHQPNDSLQSYAFQPAQPKPATTKSTFLRISPWLAVIALVLTAITAFFAYYNWRDIQLLELEYNKLAEKVGKHRESQEKFLSELIELMTEQEKTHQYSLEELEKKMKNALETQGYDASAFNSTTNSSTGSSRLWRDLLLVSTTGFLLLRHQ